METITLKVDNSSPDYHLENILNDHGYNGLIPSNVIVNKRRPALGATHGEIIAERHSIIIEPFITVIEVKKKEFKDKICAVIREFQIDDIIVYLESEVDYKKILTTPESFRKVIRALKKYDPYYRRSFFLLIDESEKLIQHASFRNRIFDPIEEFFQFENKALISATPITPSDPRFIEQGFKKLDILPTFPYQKNISIIATNNLRTSLRNTIKRLELKGDNRPVFLFTNCKRTILYFTRLEQVKGDFKVFCAEDLDEKFYQKNHTNNVQYSVTEQNYAQYNAFTSRFFAAVDMRPVESPHVIMVTNVPFVTHSSIDPQTEAIQIYGRARNTPASITHITNLYPLDLKDETETELELYFIKRLQDKADKSTNSLEKNVINSLIDKELLAVTLKADGSIEPFLKDNYDLCKSVRKLYKLPHLLIKSYEESQFFKPTLITVQHQFSDADELKLERSNGIQRNKEFINQLHDLLNQFESFYSEQPHEYYYQLKRLESEDEFLFNAYRELGYDMIRQVGFSKSGMKQEIFEMKRKDNNLHFQMIDKILLSFKLNVKVLITEVVDKLQAIYNQYNYESKPGVIKKAKGTDIVKYFNCKPYNGKRKVDDKYRTFYILYNPIDNIATSLRYMIDN